MTSMCQGHGDAALWLGHHTLRSWALSQTSETKPEVDTEAPRAALVMKGPATGSSRGPQCPPAGGGS